MGGEGKGRKGRALTQSVMLHSRGDRVAADKISAALQVRGRLQA